MARIGSARIDEDGHISGGVAGDQTGREVAIENFYMHSKKWLAFKPKDRAVALALAQAMKDACENNNIGYDQKERLGVYTWVNAGIKIKKIDKPTECDCSALVRACILEATGISLLNFNTSSEPNVLKNSGMFEPAFEVRSESQLEVGMILVTKTKGHTVIVVEAGVPTGSKMEQVPVKPADPSKIDSAKFCDSSIAGKYITTAQLNLRTGAGTSKGIIFELPYGAKVQCFGFYNKVGADKWYCVKYEEISGYCSAKYLKRV